MMDGETASISAACTVTFVEVKLINRTAKHHQSRVTFGIYVRHHVSVQLCVQHIRTTEQYNSATVQQCNDTHMTQNATGETRLGSEVVSSEHQNRYVLPNSKAVYMNARSRRLPQGTS